MVRAGKSLAPASVGPTVQMGRRRRGGNLWCSTKRFTFTPEPPSVKLSALPRPLVPETSNENGYPFPRWTCKCNQSPLRTALQLLLAFWIWRSCPLVPTHRSELQWPNHSFTTGLKRLSGDRHKEPRERCAQFGVSAVFRYVFRSTKRSSP